MASGQNPHFRDQTVSAIDRGPGERHNPSVWESNPAFAREHPKYIQMTGARTDQYTNRDDGYWGVWQLLNLAREMRGGLTLDEFV